MLKTFLRTSVWTFIILVVTMFVVSLLGASLSQRMVLDCLGIILGGNALISLGRVLETVRLKTRFNMYNVAMVAGGSFFTAAFILGFDFFLAIRPVVAMELGNLSTYFYGAAVLAVGVPLLGLALAHQGRVPRDVLYFVDGVLQQPGQRLIFWKSIPQKIEVMNRVNHYWFNESFSDLDYRFSVPGLGSEYFQAFWPIKVTARIDGELPFKLQCNNIRLIQDNVLDIAHSSARDLLQSYTVAELLTNKQGDFGEHEAVVRGLKVKLTFQECWSQKLGNMFTCRV